MRMSYVLLAVVALGCGGSGGDSGYTTGPSTGGNNNPPSGGGTGNATGFARPLVPRQVSFGITIVLARDAH